MGFNSKYSGAQVEALLDSISELQSRVVVLEEKAGIRVSGRSIITGVGNYASTNKWKLKESLPIGAVLNYTIKARTEVSYSSADNAPHTFVDLIWHLAGTTSPTNIIWENRGDVGDKYTAGAIINTGSYTLSQSSDLWLRGRFLGEVEIEWYYLTV